MATDTVTRTEARRSMGRRSIDVEGSALNLYGQDRERVYKQIDTPLPNGHLKDAPKEELVPGRKIDVEDYPFEHVTEVDSKDKGTPDQWLKRHPGLIRLTGRSDIVLGILIARLQLSWAKQY